VQTNVGSRGAKGFCAEGLQVSSEKSKGMGDVQSSTAPTPDEKGRPRKGPFRKGTAGSGTTLACEQMRNGIVGKSGETRDRRELDTKRGGALRVAAA